MAHPTDGYVFIVTYGRSGSTLLQNLLNALPGYCIRGENNSALMHMARAWNAVQGSEPMQGHRQSGTSRVIDPWYGAELVDPESFGAALAQTFTDQILNLPEGTRVGGFKEIRFHLPGADAEAWCDFVTRFFPGAKVLFNTRDHSATARSGWWAGLEEGRVKTELARAEHIFKRMQKRLDQGRFLSLHYDDYNGTPEALRPLFDFLGEPFDKETVTQVMERKLTHTGTKVTI